MFKDRVICSERCDDGMLNHMGYGHTVCTNSIQHYKKFQPVVYSDNAQELEEYAEKLGLDSFDILENPLYKQQ